MSHFKRYPKSANRWTERDLSAYNIRVVYQDFSTFFGVSVPPQPQVSNEILTARNALDAQDDGAYTFLRTLSMATHPTSPTDTSATDNLGVELYNALHYTGRAQELITRIKGVNLCLETCSKLKKFESDVSITDPYCSIALIQQSVPPENQQTIAPGDCHLPRLIAKAIGVFRHNHWMRSGTGTCPNEIEVIPAVRMEGSMPVFYKMPITLGLQEAVASGKYPEEETIIYGHVPRLPRPLDRYREGMEPLDNRRIILSCFEAFKPFVIGNPIRRYEEF